MSFAKLETEEKERIVRAMSAILNEGLIDDSDFRTRLGVAKEELAAIIDSYPNIDDEDDDSAETLSINNCLNELCFGVKAPDDVWSRIGASKNDLLDVYDKWARLRGWKSTGIR